jgi:hypothetical protein
LVENLINSRTESMDEIEEMKHKLDDQISQMRFRQENMMNNENEENEVGEFFGLENNR